MPTTPKPLRHTEGRKVFFLQREFHSGGIAFRFKTKYNNGGAITIALPEPIAMRAYPASEEEAYHAAAYEQMPLMNLHEDEAQQLMDELWNCGLRPSEGSGSAGALAATQRHLEDFRLLVFKTKPKQQS